MFSLEVVGAVWHDGATILLRFLYCALRRCRWRGGYFALFFCESMPFAVFFRLSRSILGNFLRLTCIRKVKSPYRLFFLPLTHTCARYTPVA